LRFFQPRHQPFCQRPLVTHVADQDQIETLAAADHVFVHSFDGERIGLGIAGDCRHRKRIDVGGNHMTSASLRRRQRHQA